MRRSVRFALVLGGILAASTLLAPVAEAQWRHRPFYNPFFHRGFYGWGPYDWPGYSPQWPRGAARVDEDAVVVRPDVSPDAAQIYVDGYFRGTVSDYDGRFRGLVVEPGEHEFVLYLQGYRSARRTVELRGGTVYRLREKLVRLREGEASEPPPAPAPRAEQELSVPEREPVPERAEPLPGRPAPGELPRRIPRPPSDAPRDRPDVEARNDRPGVEARGFGSVAVRAQPAGAEVLIDGERWEGIEGRPLVVQLAEGRHRIEVRLEGYEPFSTDVQVREGETVPLNVSLPARR